MREKPDTLLILCFVTGILASSMAAASPMWLGERYEVRASSELKSDKSAYAAKKLIPPSLGTAWCEGVEGDGVDEWVELELREPMTSDAGFRLEILPGYIASSATYQKNNRPRTISVTLNDDPAERQIALEDYGKFQSFFFAWSGTPVKKIRLKIQGVYKGDQFADTCITDIALRQLPQKKQEGSLDHEAQADKEVAMLRGIDPAKIDRDALSFIMGLSEGRYYTGAEGRETLNEDYMDALMHNPGLFLWVLDKQSNSVVDAISKAIVSPVNDKYSESEIRGALKKGLAYPDPGARARLQPLLDAYSVK